MTQLFDHWKLYFIFFGHAEVNKLNTNKVVLLQGAWFHVISSLVQNKTQYTAVLLYLPLHRPVWHTDIHKELLSRDLYW